MADAFLEDIFRAEMSVGGEIYPAIITRKNKVDYRTIQISTRCEDGEGIVEAVTLLNNKDEVLIHVPRNMEKKINEFVSTAILFDLYPTDHPAGDSIPGIGGYVDE